MKINIVLLTLVLFSCNCRHSDCNDIYLGTLKLSDTTEYWIPYKQGDRITLKNTNNYTAVFENYIIEKDTSQTTFTEENGHRGCDPAVPCFKYYNLESKIYKFRSDSIPISIEIERTKNAPQVMSAYPVQLPSDDILKVMINESSFIINLNNDTLYNSYIDKPTTTDYLDSISLGNQTFYNVYHSYYLNNYSPSGPQGIYYHRTKGLICFYLLNNETWILQ